MDRSYDYATIFWVPRILLREGVDPIDTPRIPPHLSLPGPLRLWFGVLVGPLAWMTQVLTMYFLVDLRCPDHATAMPAHVVSAFTLLLSTLAALVSVTHWRAPHLASLAPNWESFDHRSLTSNGGEIGRAAFLGLQGIFMGSLFAAVIGAQWIVVFLLLSCSAD